MTNEGVPYSGIETEIQTGTLLRESPLAKETEGKPVTVITIGGRGGTGKTATLHAFARLIEEYTGKNVDVFKVGEELVRKPLREATGEEVLGAEDTPLEKDRAIEAIMAERIRNATPDRILLMEGWTAALNAQEVINQAIQNGETPPVVVSFLLTAKYRTRMPRIAKRQGVSKHRAEIATRAREKANYGRFEKLYPRIQGRDMFNPANKDNQGRPIYTAIIGTNEIDYPAVALTGFIWLANRGNLLPRTDDRQDGKADTKRVLPDSADVFPPPSAA